MYSLCILTNSCPTLWDSWTVDCQAPLSMEFSMKECWSGLPFPSPGALPNPGIKPRSPASQADSYCLSRQGMDTYKYIHIYICIYMGSADVLAGFDDL